MFYGWRVVAALFIVLTFTSGLGFYNHAILLQALANDPRFPIELTSGAVSLFFVTSGVSSLFIAPLLERYDPRWLIVAGAVIAAGALGWIGRVQTVTELYVAYFIFGMGFAASGLIPATTLVARWFVRYRARALSVASTGLSIGGVLVTPVSALMVNSVELGTATTWMAAAYFLGVVPATLIAVRASPQQMGLAPDGVKEVTATGGTVAGLTLRQATRHKFFWTLSISYIFVMAAQVGGIAHQFGVVSERLDAVSASFAITLLPIFSVIGRLAGGLLLEKISIVRFTVLMMVMQGAALALVAFGNQPTVLYIGLSLFGVTVGNLLMLQPLIIAQFFGLVQYPRIYAWSNLVTQAGVAVGPALLGYLYATSGSYSLPYVVAAGFGLMACVVFALANPPVNPERG